MSMRRSDAPRFVYVRKGFAHLCFSGKLFGHKADKSAFEKGSEVLIETMPSNGGRARIKVTSPSDPKVSEVWTSIKL